jgi:hypothetical protein
MAVPTGRKVLEQLVPQLELKGFAYDRQRECLTRPFSEGLQLIACNLTRLPRSLSVQPVLGLRFDRVERAKEAAGVVPQGFAEGTTTLLASARRFAGLEGTVCGLPLDTPLERLVGLCLEAVRPLAADYFAKRATLPQLDELVNGVDPEACRFDTEPPHRCFTGAVAAWLVDRPDSDDLFRRYQAQLTSYSKGFYLADYQQLVAHLRAHPELRSSAAG